LCNFVYFFLLFGLLFNDIPDLFCCHITLASPGVYTHHGLGNIVVKSVVPMVMGTSIGKNMIYTYFASA
jgi:hypothetical protein